MVRAKNDSRFQKLTLFVFLVFTFLLYSYRLDLVPVHLNQDELMFSLNAHSISQNLTDFYGNRLPFYFWHLSSFWATPITVYFTALVLKFLPISEASIRLSSVLVAVFSAFLITRITKDLFNKDRLSILAGVLLITSPAMFINSRLLMDIIYTIPFVLLWLFFLIRYTKQPSIMSLFFSGLFLGIGLHSYHAGKVIMPTYFLVSFFLIPVRKELKRALAFAAGFSIPVFLFIPWLQAHPDTLLNQVSYVGSIDKSVSVGSGIWGVINLSRAQLFLTNFFSYFDPRLLFITGDRSAIHSTGNFGVFLFPLAFLIIFGILHVATKQKDKISKIILFGFLTYPLAPALVNDPDRISRALVVIPFGVLLAIYGIYFLLSQKDKLFKYLLIFIITFSVFQFGIFLKDYFGNYRERSYRWFNGNIGGVIESALRSTKIREVDTIYIDSQIPFGLLYYQFYQLKLDTPFDSLKAFDPNKDNFIKFSPRSLVVLSSSSVPRGKPTKIGGFEKIETIREPDGNETFFVYYR